MTDASQSYKTTLWPRETATYVIESIAIIMMSVVSMLLQQGSLEYHVLLSNYSVLTIFGSLITWFSIRFILNYILQSRIDANKITQYLPFEMLVATATLTSFMYLIVYLILSYLEDVSFVLADFLQGYIVSVGLTSLIVVLFLGREVWKSWWVDGEFLFHVKDHVPSESNSQDFITIKNPKGTINFDLQKVGYFISESKITFLVDNSGKKWMTQYTLSEIEDKLGSQFFRLNRSILVSRQVISQIKKLPNHRLLVTIGQSIESRNETTSRYKSTRFKQWFHDPQA